MSTVIAVPELMTEAATDLATIGTNLSAAHMTAAAPTVAVLPAAADEVSAGIAHLFSGYAEDYQKLAGEAAASYEQFVQHLTASAGAYASAEAANTALLQPLAATADSIRSAVGAFWDQLGTMFNTAVGQLTSRWDQFTTALPQIIFGAFILGFICYLILGTILLNLISPIYFLFSFFGLV
jgi:hypothetical protein